MTAVQVPEASAGRNGALRTDRKDEQTQGHWKHRRDRKNDQRNYVSKRAYQCSGQKLVAQHWSVQWETDGEAMCQKLLVCCMFQ